jgi:hypothetical protein
MIRDAKLCFVYGPWAWFTTRDLSDQCGDDWDDAPYEHNASCPYGSDDEHLVFQVAYEGPFVEPDDAHHNSPYSVEQINRKAMPWLRTEPWLHKQEVQIPAGTTFREFIRLIYSAGGTVYVECQPTKLTTDRQWRELEDTITKAQKK